MNNQREYVDFSFLKNLTGGDKNVMLEVFNLFKIEVPKYFAEINLSYQTRNWEALAAIAHKSKSSFALMGINSVVTELKRLELLAKEMQENEAFQEIINHVELVYNASIIELEDLLK